MERGGKRFGFGFVVAELGFEGEDKFRLEDATFTTCKPGNDDWFVRERGPDELREAIRDLTGILRAMYAAEREQHRRAYIAVAGKRLAELSLVLDQPGTGQGAT